GDKRIQVTSATGGSQQKLNVLYEFKAEEQGQQDSSMMKHVKFGVKCLPYVGALYKYGSDLMNCKDAYYQIYETPVDFKITTLPVDSPQAVLPNTAYTFKQLADELGSQAFWQSVYNVGSTVVKDKSTGYGIGLALGFLGVPQVLADYLGGNVDDVGDMAGDYVQDMFF